MAEDESELWTGRPVLIGWGVEPCLRMTSAAYRDWTAVWRRSFARCAPALFEATGETPFALWPQTPGFVRPAHAARLRPDCPEACPPATSFAVKRHAAFSLPQPGLRLSPSLGPACGFLPPSARPAAFSLPRPGLRLSPSLGPACGFLPPSARPAAFSLPRPGLRQTPALLLGLRLVSLCRAWASWLLSLPWFAGSESLLPYTRHCLRAFSLPSARLSMHAPSVSPACGYASLNA